MGTLNIDRHVDQRREIEGACATDRTTQEVNGQSGADAGHETVFPSWSACTLGPFTKPGNVTTIDPAW